MEVFLEKVVHLFGSICKKNVGKNRAKRFLENSSFLVRVAIYFLIPHEEFKTEKILHPNGNLLYSHKIGTFGIAYHVKGKYVIHHLR